MKQDLVLGRLDRRPKIQHQGFFLTRRQVTTEDRELDVFAGAFEDLKDPAKTPRIADVIGDVIAARHRVWKLG
jgi:hypothetical protein